MSEDWERFNQARRQLMPPFDENLLLSIITYESARAVVCQARASGVQEVAKKAAVAATTLPAMIAANPAFALVSEEWMVLGVGCIEPQVDV
jgi:hypothetical protein